MARGFGTTQPKQPSSNQSGSKQPCSTQREAELEAEIEAFLLQEEQAQPDNYAQAWRAGVYNPLSQMTASARPLTAEETDWLFLTAQVGWLKVQHELDALYFTAPPPFDPNQADWYLRPDLTTWLESPMRLNQAVIKYPVPQDLLLQSLNCQTQRLRWSLKQTEAFIQRTVDKPTANLTSEDFVVLLLELQGL